MSIPQKVKAVEAVFHALEGELRQFQNQTPLRCLTGCGECCKKPDIEATVLEMIPLAYHWYQTGTAEAWLDRLETSDADPLCKLFNPFGTLQGKGNCEHYAYRGLVCRLFGFAANLNKYGKPLLATCKLLKEEKAEAYQQTQAWIDAGGRVPMIRDYYMKLYAIDPTLSEQRHPINTAIRLALEKVLLYYYYQTPKAS
ncbi:Fe-S-cluster containining protein [Catalinimonas alkaloidigena]|uniref:Fe-S-cluster containining protein n=1 Tax=Catalinimonas alkaloidigena TaxID=1075417 RepID=A0A1G8WWF4_9BACT|nr:YkgJ family cysteine cluster protein [Catalinimonas alkaloidigena]SDJ82541.1 Fe-S-cluster containining protein [Catalinimonas alkaloidigena]